ncbi:MAG: CvpA family protein [Lachnospiraceae bacterium]|nr:CvpA family protein [Lachnospiraceae bacterium]
MLGTLLLVVVLIYIAIEAWKGYRRGVIYSAVRLLWMVPGITVAVCLAERVTRWLLLYLAKLRGYEFENIKELSYYVLYQAGCEEEAVVFALPFGALLLSFCTPLVFVILLLLTCVVTYFLYRMVRWGLKRKGLKQPGKGAKWAGVLLGGVFGICFSALLVLPFAGISRLLERNDTLVTIDELIETEDFEILTLYDASPLSGLYRYTGMEAFTGWLYAELSEVSAESVEVGAEAAASSYSFPDSMEQLLKKMPEVVVLAEGVREPETISEEHVDAIEELTEFCYHTELLKPEEIVYLGNRLLKRASRQMDEQELWYVFLEDRSYDTLEALEADTKAVLDMAEILIREEVLQKYLDGDYTRLRLSESAAGELVDAFAAFSDGGIVAARFINRLTEQLSEGELEQLVYEEDLRNLSEKKEELVQLLSVAFRIVAAMEVGVEELSMEETKELLLEVQALEGQTIVRREKYMALLNLVKGQ